MENNPVCPRGVHPKHSWHWRHRRSHDLTHQTTDHEQNHSVRSESSCWQERQCPVFFTINNFLGQQTFKSLLQNVLAFTTGNLQMITQVVGKLHNLPAHERSPGFQPKRHWRSIFLEQAILWKVNILVKRQHASQRWWTLKKTLCAEKGASVCRQSRKKKRANSKRIEKIARRKNFTPLILFCQSWENYLKKLASTCKV